jgi:hypothetical protein
MRKAALILICLLFLAGCAVATPTPAVIPPIATRTAKSATLVPTITAAPTKVSTTASTLVPTTAPTAAPTLSSAPGTVAVDVSAQVYIDDRSTGLSLLASLFNAVNRHEYLRAYSYWEPGGSIKGTTLEEFTNGYSTTASVQLIVGPMTEGAAAGNLYTTISIVLNAVTTNGQNQQFVACYLLHLASPGVQGTLPFRSLGIQQGKARAVAAGTDALSLLSSLCTDFNIPTGGSTPAQTVFDPANISSARYLDDRSDAVQVLRSYFNAINRHEFLRAYSYWETTAASASLPSLEQFTAGYSDTLEVKLTVGQVIEDAGAGQFHYRVPVTLVASTTTGQTQTFVGCYVLHISNPGIQGTMPFQPIGIITANVLQVNSAANAAKLIASACN